MFNKHRTFQSEDLQLVTTEHKRKHNSLNSEHIYIQWERVWLEYWRKVQKTDVTDSEMISPRGGGTGLISTVQTWTVLRLQNSFQLYSPIPSIVHSTRATIPLFILLLLTVYYVPLISQSGFFWSLQCTQRYFVFCSSFPVSCSSLSLISVSKCSPSWTLSWRQLVACSLNLPLWMYGRKSSLGSVVVVSVRLGWCCWCPFRILLIAGLG